MDKNEFRNIILKYQNKHLSKSKYSVDLLKEIGFEIHEMNFQQNLIKDHKNFMNKLNMDLNTNLLGNKRDMTNEEENLLSDIKKIVKNKNLKSELVNNERETQFIIQINNIRITIYLNDNKVIRVRKDSCNMKNEPIELITLKDVINILNK